MPLEFITESPDQPSGSKRIPSEVWDLYKPAIVQKYDHGHENKTLQVVRKEMEQEYKFIATYVPRYSE